MHISKFSLNKFLKFNYISKLCFFMIFITLFLIPIIDISDSINLKEEANLSENGALSNEKTTRIQKYKYFIDGLNKNIFSFYCGILAQHAYTVLAQSEINSGIVNQNNVDSNNLSPTDSFDTVKVDYSNIDYSKYNNSKDLPIKILIEADKTKYELNEQIEYIIFVKNFSLTKINYFTVSATLFDGAIPKSILGASVSGNNLTWNIDSLSPNKILKIPFSIKVGSLDFSEQEVLTTVKAIRNGYEEIPENNSSLKTLVFKSNIVPGFHDIFIKGFPDNTFRADQYVTRAEAATMAAKVSNYKIYHEGIKIFKDLEAEHWSSKYVASVVADKVMSGYEDGTFKPERNISRAEVAVLIANMIGIKNVLPIKLNFNDIHNHWATNQISEIFRYKIISGYPDNSFKPNNPVKRSEFITMLCKAKFRGPLDDGQPIFTDLEENHWSYQYVAEASVFHKYKRNIDGIEIPIE